jgi:hypothetical protein
MPFPPSEAPKGATSYHEPSNYLNRKNAELPIEHSGIWKADSQRPWLGLIETPVPWGGYVTKEAMNVSGMDPRSQVTFFNSGG